MGDLGQSARVAGLCGVLILFLAACSGGLSTHGNIADAEAVESIEPGVTTRDEVARILGTPSATSPFGEERWLYVGERIRRIAFLDPEVLERKILVVHFDSNGILTKIETLDEDDGQEIEVVDRKTPSLGRSPTFLQQVFGNIGRFGNPDPVDSGP